MWRRWSVCDDSESLISFMIASRGPKDSLSPPAITIEKEASSVKVASMPSRSAVS
jgi:hypothetical protein